MKYGKSAWTCHLNHNGVCGPVRIVTRLPRLFGSRDPLQAEVVLAGKLLVESLQKHDSSRGAQRMNNLHVIVGGEQLLALRSIAIARTIRSLGIQSFHPR